MRTQLIRLAITLLILFGVSVTATICLSQSLPASSKAHTLADLEFISGHWTGEMDGGTTDEHWSAPSGDNMMGVFRYVKGGKAVFYEMLLIEMTATGPVLRLKHFNPGLIGWEEQTQVYSYALVDVARHKAVFESPEKTTRMTFQRTSPDLMVVVLERMKEGKMTAQEFKYRRGQ